jgi:alanyl-tRNA synthetase
LKWTGLNELRERFLSFSEGKCHVRLQSAPLVPQEDASLLLINSGMAPLKKYFLGLETIPGNRATSCQKCIRTPDIERVGKTSRHGTFFEMLGNFSFGDYFKEEATTWAWEFLTETLEIPKELLHVSVYQDDDDAYRIWTQRRGVDPSHMVRLGKEDNFWEIGSGPCGPCSEIYFDRGPESGCGKPDCAVGCDCDRYVEIWNLVFTQFNSDGAGDYTPLARPNIDTGMGLERLACVMQGVGNLFEVDTIQNIMKHVCDLAEVAYKRDEKTDISLRVVSDHIRSTVFMVGDGVVPQNEGRGYVLRRLLRRAARHGRLMGVTEPFLYKVCSTVIRENKTAYPELAENEEYICKVIRVEEERFSRTIEQGMQLLSGILDTLEAKNESVVSGEDAFRLYDTFGFPVDLTMEITQDRGVTVDEEGFLAFMQQQRERARHARAEAGGVSWEEDVLADIVIADRFAGYQSMVSKTKVLAIIREGELVDSIAMGEQAMLVLEETPFYAESGGQTGDTGIIASSGKNIFTVQGCKKSPTGHILHIGTMQGGLICKADPVTARVDTERRHSIMRNHTATHLLQAALRQLLGDHVHQAGSYVDDQVMRFDFTHFSAVTPEQLDGVEKWVNDRIFEADDVHIAEMSMDEARELGATALFGDKYGDTVRVVTIPGKSMELCGGTHVSNTARIGVFKLLSESSVAAGVRRIEGTTGRGVTRYIRQQNEIIAQACEALRVNSPLELAGRAAASVASVKTLQREKEALEAKLAEQQMGALDSGLVEIGSVKLTTAVVSGPIEPLRNKADDLKAKHADIVGVFVADSGQKIQALAFAGKDAVAAGIHCGNLVKEVSAAGGGSGGGRPDNAMGAIPAAAGIEAAIAAVPGVIRKQLGL